MKRKIDEIEDEFDAESNQDETSEEPENGGKDKTDNTEAPKAVFEMMKNLVQKSSKNIEISGQIKDENVETTPEKNLNDGQKTDNKSHSNPEGKAAFKVMKRMVKRARNEQYLSRYQLKFPSCLNDIIMNDKQLKFPCTICGKLFCQPDQLVVHSNEHGRHDNPYAECCFCGLSLGDSLRLRLHQISMPVKTQCYTCLEVFSDFNELNHHNCVEHKAGRPKTGILCKLGCSNERHFPNEEALELHMFSLHGASLEDDLADQDAMKYCILCRCFVNAYRLSLEDHTFFRCNGRHPWIKENIVGLYNLAKDQGLNLSMLIKLELECQLEEWKAREALRGQTFQTHAQSIIKIPISTSKDIVMKCLGKEDKKYNPSEFPFLLPPAMTMTKNMFENINAKRDTLKLFHHWNSIVSLNFSARGPNQASAKVFEDLAADMFKNLNQRLPQLNDEKKRYRIPTIKYGKLHSRLDWDDPPSEDVLTRLESQLGTYASEEAIMNPSDYDRMILASNNMNIRELLQEHDEEINGKEDDMDPSDFVQVEQSS